LQQLKTPSRRYNLPLRAGKAALQNAGGSGGLRNRFAFLRKGFAAMRPGSARVRRFAGAVHRGIAIPQMDGGTTRTQRAQIVTSS
jgi:hypothetical protein